MRVITNILRAQHIEIQGDINHLRVLLSDPEVVEHAEVIKAAISRLEHRLTVHLVQEDTLFYPKLVNHPGDGVQKIAYQVIKELGDLGEAFEEFIKRWRTSSAIADQPEEFLVAIAKLLEALETRLKMENEVLFPLVE